MPLGNNWTNTERGSFTWLLGPAFLKMNVTDKGGCVFEMKRTEGSIIFDCNINLDFGS